MENIFYVVTQETFMQKDHFLKDADPHYCEGGKCDESNYFPLTEGYSSQFFSSLEVNDNKVVKGLELLLGIDEVEIDDSLLGLSFRKKNFVNFKGSRLIVDKSKHYHKTDDNIPLLITYVGLQTRGRRHQRFVLGWMKMLSEVGGLFVGLNKVFMIAVLVVCHIKFNTKLISII